MTLGCTDSEPALESAERVEVLIAATEYHLVYINGAAIAELDGQI